MIEFVLENYNWMFSGFFSGLIFWFLGYRYGCKKHQKQSLKTGNNSTAYQAGKNIQLKNSKDKD